MKYGQRCLAGLVCVFIKARASEDNVIALPLTGLAACVPEGWMLTINGTALSIGVGLVLEGVEDLNLVARLQVDTTIAATLT